MTIIDIPHKAIDNTKIPEMMDLVEANRSSLKSNLHMKGWEICAGVWRYRQNKIRRRVNLISLLLSMEVGLQKYLVMMEIHFGLDAPKRNANNMF